MSVKKIFLLIFLELKINHLNFTVELKIKKKCFYLEYSKLFSLKI